MALMNEKVTEVWSTCSEPCLYYNKVWTWFQNGDLSSEMWDIFVMACLKSLMEKNNKTLETLVKRHEENPDGFDDDEDI